MYELTRPENEPTDPHALCGGPPLQRVDVIAHMMLNAAILFATAPLSPCPTGVLCPTAAVIRLATDPEYQAETTRLWETIPEDVRAGIVESARSHARVIAEEFAVATEDALLAAAIDELTK